MSDYIPVDVFGYALKKFSNEIVVQGKYTAGVAVAQLLAMALAPKNHKLVAGNILLWLPAGPLLCYLAAKESLSTYIGTSIETRTLSVTPSGISAIRGYVALQLVGTVVEVVRMLRMEPKKRSKQFPIIVHHIVSILACVSTQYHRRLMSSACCLICVEFSTIFLNLLLFTKSEAFKPWLEKNVPWLEGLSGVGLWLTFIVFRILLVPYIVYRWIADATSGDPSTLNCNKLEVIYPLIVAILVWVLSLTWFKRIHKGFMKSMKKLLKNKKHGKDENKKRNA